LLRVASGLVVIVRPSHSAMAFTVMVDEPACVSIGALNIDP